MLRPLDSKPSRIRVLRGLILSGLVMPACSNSDVAPPKSDPASNPVVAGTPAAKKGTPGKPARQVPGSSDYEDKPVADSRGR